MDLTKSFLPDSVLVSGRTYKIKTGHPYWFRFSQLLGQDKTLLTEFDFLYLSDIPDDRQAGIDELCNFYYEKKEIPRVEGDTGDRVLDYDIDSDLIYSAILQCYGVDIYEKQIHWHKMRAMLAGLNATRLNDVMGYRCYKGDNKDIMRMKRVWALPEIMSAEDKAALDAFNAQFD